jgi:imidazole glycerol-phosphate synthase subunit HisF
MLRPRIIPSLLIHENGLVKTVNFKDPKYVGDPINAVKIFNEKQVDELVFFDIDATVLNREPDYSLIEKLANQSRMPLCYGGGVKTVEQAQKIFSLGIEKIALSSAVIQNPSLVTQIAQRVGSQSVIVVLDIKKKLFGGYEVYTHNGKKATGINPIKFAQELEALGVGELVLNSIEKVVENISIPVTVLGGAGSLKDIETVIEKNGVIGVAAGSMFVFKGPYKAVLINYPNQEEKNNLFKSLK